MKPEKLERGEKAENHVMKLLNKNGWIAVHNNGYLRRQAREIPFQFPEEHRATMNKALKSIPEKEREELKKTIEFFNDLFTTFRICSKMKSTKFDFIARKGHLVIMGDTKAKTGTEFRIDEDFHKDYREFDTVVPFLMFFCTKDNHVYVGMTRDPKTEPILEKKPDYEKQKNVYIIPQNETMEITEWFNKDCSIEALKNLLPK